MKIKRDYSDAKRNFRSLSRFNNFQKEEIMKAKRME